ncbi:hypothetical protein PIROE2DRAFT_1463 [Piromyces sp. E2]|nr:hypothetical protein PIROE2DRAFT_1463 [Piromyces sp. E2]|eukprot:OUM70330.1 hypothetical protein PIROE2DRAFT_1463 [Piromyces sp. E2]
MSIIHWKQVCEFHNKTIFNVCLNKECHNRFLCMDCFKCHDTSHCPYFVPLCELIDKLLLKKQELLNELYERVEVLKKNVNNLSIEEISCLYEKINNSNNSKDKEDNDIKIKMESFGELLKFKFSENIEDLSVGEIGRKKKDTTLNVNSNYDLSVDYLKRSYLSPNKYVFVYRNNNHYGNLGILFCNFSSYSKDICCYSPVSLTNCYVTQEDIPHSSRGIDYNKWASITFYHNNDNGTSSEITKLICNLSNSKESYQLYENNISIDYKFYKLIKNRY